MGDASHSFSAYFKRAASPIIVLAILRERPMYGYEISSAIRERSGGEYTISVLYPILSGLLEEGYISEGEQLIVGGRARKYYAITPLGLEYLNTTRSEFEKLAELFRELTGGTE